MCLPSEYTVPAAESFDKPGILVIEDAQGFKYIGYEVGLGVKDGMIANIIPALDIAKGICLTHINAQIFTDVSTGIQPGIFAIEGEWPDAEVVKNTFTALWNEHRANEIRYNEKLVAEGDDAWTRFRQHKFIAGSQRDAAQILGKKREWAERVNVVKIDCEGCGEYVSPNVIVCKHCGFIVNKERFSPEKFIGGAPSVTPAVLVKQ